LKSALSDGLGKGFDRISIHHMRRFFSRFPIIDALRRELSWAYYRFLLWVEKADSRHFGSEGTKGLGNRIGAGRQGWKNKTLFRAS
jgi:hypothetical protein